MKTRRVSKRKAGRHGHGTVEQIVKWGEHWSRFSGAFFKKKHPPRTYSRPNPPIDDGWSVERHG